MLPRFHAMTCWFSVFSIDAFVAAASSLFGVVKSTEIDNEMMTAAVRIRFMTVLLSVNERLTFVSFANAVLVIFNGPGSEGRLRYSDAIRADVAV